MEIAGRAERTDVLDTWMALLAGDQAWRDGPNEEPDVREPGVGAFMLAALAMTLLVHWVAIVSRVDPFADDAGGFDLDDVPPGHGLALLCRELGDGGLERSAAPGGSTVVARIPISLPHSRKEPT